MNRSIAKYGWKPDLPDNRDLRYSIPAHFSEDIPESMDLRSLCPPIYDQGNLGSCTANAIAGAFEFDLIRQNLSVFTPSRLFIYYNERVIEGTISTDSGAYLRDGIKSLANQGVCNETEWPYIINEFIQKPFQSCYDEAQKNIISQYQRLDRSLDQMKACLADGSPFIFGFAVYQNFESAEVARTGILNLPNVGESLIGGHAVVAVGYDDLSRRFIARNSWRDTWGMQGYFTLPYDYLLDENLADDFWTIKSVA